MAKDWTHKIDGHIKAVKKAFKKVQKAHKKLAGGDGSPPSQPLDQLEHAYELLVSGSKRFE